MKKYILLLFPALCTFYSFYPVDGYERTGIRRLLYLNLISDGEMKGRTPKPGAYKKLEDIQLHLADLPRYDSLGALPPIDEELQEQLSKLFPYRSNYSMTLMQVAPNEKPRYAAHKAEQQYQPGSVGKLAVITAIFCELQNLYPDSFEKRVELLKNRMVTGREFAVYDHHTIPVFDLQDSTFRKRRANQKDVFSLYEWIDHMVSVSNNGAASVVWREALLMREFQDKYEKLTEDEADEYFKNADRRDLAEFSQAIVNQPLREHGITHDEWRLGTMFTRGASGIVPPKGGSTGTPKGLMKWMLMLEMGDIIDPWSSLEIKRLIYLTDRRIRYASNKGLDSTAVYYKSGSLYKCDRNRDPGCKKYAGNVYNYMNSVAIVERPDSVSYMSCLMTNVLRRNSAWDHNRLAGQVDDLFPKRDLKKNEEMSEEEVMKIEGGEADAEGD